MSGGKAAIPVNDWAAAETLRNIARGLDDGTLTRADMTWIPARLRAIADRLAQAAHPTGEGADR